MTRILRRTYALLFFSVHFKFNGIAYLIFIKLNSHETLHQQKRKNANDSIKSGINKWSKDMQPQLIIYFIIAGQNSLINAMWLLQNDSFCHVNYRMKKYPIREETNECINRYSSDLRNDVLGSNRVPFT